MKLTKRNIDLVQPKAKAYFLWDDELIGFGLSVSPNGAKSYVVKYRAGRGRKAPSRRMVIARVGKVTPDEARTQARTLIAEAALGGDPIMQDKAERQALTFAELAELYMERHMRPKRKPRSVEYYESVLRNNLLPALNRKRAQDVTRLDVSRLHHELATTPAHANRVIAVLCAIYSYAEREELWLDVKNPARRIEKYKENARERYLLSDELASLGQAIRKGETVGLSWQVDDSKPTSKHTPKNNRTTKLDPYAAAALRLLIFTGARLREILHLKWEHVDLERGMLFLPDSKTGKKTIVLNAPALQILSNLPRSLDTPFVIAGQKAGQPRADLKRPWDAVREEAGLEGVRLHDLRHNFASIGAGGGLGLPIIGKLLGQTQASTTQRYAHLDNDPVRRASNTIASQIAGMMGEGITATVIKFKSRKTSESKATDLVEM